MHIDRFPKIFESGIFYWSKEYEISAHKCACGCGDVIQLPIDDQNFNITIEPTGFTLRPSVGNWGICDSHYYITRGGVEWLPQMSQATIVAGRQAEDARREAHYSHKPTWWQRLRGWVGDLIRRVFS
ncbi:DUF6527 family protein [Methylobacterium sp. J-072]|uniref:DUF6527 family protein n=1 Tax=Methylobacterium sp. J-072 TaxID=2836651 RepID=UPI00391D541B